MVVFKNNLHIYFYDTTWSFFINLYFRILYVLFSLLLTLLLGNQKPILVVERKNAIFFFTDVKMILIFYEYNIGK